MIHVRQALLRERNRRCWASYFHRACRRAGIGRWTPYEMRHSAASLLSHEGVPLELVADTLGHDGTRMAREIYRHAIAPTVTAAAGPMQRLFGQPAREPDGDVSGSPDGSLGQVAGGGTKE